MHISFTQVVARSGAVAFAIWGLLHVALGASMIVAGLDEGLSGGELEAESLMFFSLATVIGTACTLVAVMLNWRNSTFGFWLNVLLVVPVDAALVVVLIRPAHIDAIGGAVGPVVATVAVVLASTGQISRRTSRPGAPSAPSRTATP